jgi:hypothetical protein
MISPKCLCSDARKISRSCIATPVKSRKTRSGCSSNVPKGHPLACSVHDRLWHL